MTWSRIRIGGKHQDASDNSGLARSTRSLLQFTSKRLVTLQSFATIEAKPAEKVNMSFAEHQVFDEEAYTLAEWQELMSSCELGQVG